MPDADADYVATMLVQTSPSTAPGSAPSSILGMAKSILQKEGALGFYRGLGVTLMGSPAASMLYFTTYEMTRDWLQQASPLLARHDGLTFFLGGMIAETASCVLWVPIDVIKERMQIQPHRRTAASAAAPPATAGVYYKSTLDAVRQIMSSEGIRGIYKGYGATVFSFGPFSALYFLGYEELKGLEAALTGRSQEVAVPFLASMACAATAGAGASFLTTPLDLAKLRLQVQRGAVAAAAAGKAGGGAEAGAFAYTGFLDALSTIWAREGVRGLFRGAGARMAFHIPATAVQMSLFESCKQTAQALTGRGGTAADADR